MSVAIHEEIEPYLVDIDTVKAHPDNPNNGDTDAIAESILANGFYNPIVVQRSTGYIIAGNHRYAAMLQLGQTKIPAITVEVDDERAIRMLIADNRTAELAVRNLREVNNLMKALEKTDEGIAGTGYDEDGLEELRRVLNATEHIGFGQLSKAVEDVNETTHLVVLRGRLVDGQVYPFDRDELDEVQNVMRELGYKAIIETGGF